MTPECLAEQERLLARTADLQQRTQELAEPDRPFLQSEHDELKARLSEHQADLAAFRERCLGRRLK